ncbi:hypothetical protein SAMN05443665_105310 [Actinomadura meyerae]|uniref:YGGT family protein n=1 Tax=Actinomadura meyerae TaxID=240840 RepID=A0A239NXT9_9ACTN|nr:hypothetical protein [Actinomadura meyerae]SNT59522.1 hypothetical protein SAMN05443665_105310 [Actinomadura meyerae]
MADPTSTSTSTGTSTGTSARTEPGGEHRAPGPRRQFTARAAGVRRRAAGALATLVSVVTTVVVAVLAVHIVFVAFEANTANGIVHWFGERAVDLSWQFKDVFQPANPKAEVAVNYGLAALVYLVIGRALVGVVRRLA